jgi:DNA replication protein DnaC
MDKLKLDGHVYDGFPVKCEQHPDRVALLTEKDHFDTVCPNGGCSEPWYVHRSACKIPTINPPSGKLLNCGVHSCPHRCHQLQDHSKMQCMAIVSSKCPNNHKVSRRCHDKAAATCKKCEAAIRAQEKRRQRDHQLDQERQAKQRAYLARLFEIEDEIEHQKRLLKNRAEEADHNVAVAQKEKDLENFKNKVIKFDIESNSPRQHTPLAPDQSPKANGAAEQEQNACQKPPQSAIFKEKPVKGQNATSTWDQSDAKDDWEQQKRYDGAENKALDDLMSMIGLESVKEQFLVTKSKIDTLVRQDVSLSEERFGAILLGNPGTGKTTVARLYARFLGEVGALPGDCFFETSGSALANDGVSVCKDRIEKILESGGGVFFIDEAYQLVSGNSYGGKAVLDYLLAEIENLTGKVAFVLAGYHKQMEQFFAHNQGLESRMPIKLEFGDYDDQQLQQIFCRYLDKKYKGCMRVEDGTSGLYVRIVARRIGRGRGRDGFGNARDVQNKISYITSCQSKRIRKERRAGLLPDDNFLTKEDLIGPEPAIALQNNSALSKLQSMIGLASVKQTVQSLLEGIQFNYQRELEEKPLVQYSLNKCFIGSPGTGKTSVAKLYGQILADIGFLSNGEGKPEIAVLYPLLTNHSRQQKSSRLRRQRSR